MPILQRFKELIKKERDSSKDKARHVAITTSGVYLWAKNNKSSLEEAYNKSNDIIKSIIKSQIKQNLPVVTLYVLRVGAETLENFSTKIDSLINLLNDLKSSELIHKNKVKISVFGKWYDLPGRIVQPIKELLDSTKEYDQFFVNLCLNYSGKEEIVDVCKIISMQLKTEKIDIESITQETLKENTYSSDFLPPDLIIINGKRQKFDGLLLLDSVDSVFDFTNKLWPDFDSGDFEKSISDFENKKI